MRALWILAAGLAGLAWAGRSSLLEEAAPRASAAVNPFEGDEAMRAAGAKLYARECAACHGAHRQGRGNTPALDRPEVREAPPGVLFWILRNGSLHHGMPSFAHLPEPQRWQIITFLRAQAGDATRTNPH